MAESDYRDSITTTIKEGTLGLLQPYYERLHSDEASVDDMRKAIEQGLKVLGMFQNERVDNLPLVQWTITGTGSVSVDIKPALPPADVVEDVTPKDKTPAVAAPTTEAAAVKALNEFNFESLDNLLEDL
jgi:hypothetical protein